jgi:prepilin-type N-terminal cleavage/methylation domain-containing protein/prepilin-type processing-associated H-X9-DG protein
METFTGRRRGGFTMIETLAVMAVSGILISLLAPGIMAVRETAFRAYCKNNLHQIASGLIHYESTNGRLPGCGSGSGKDWAIAILPHMEQTDLFQMFEMNASAFSAINNSAAKNCPKAYQCPSIADRTFVMENIPPAHYGLNPYLAEIPISHLQLTTRTILAGELSSGTSMPWVASPVLVGGNIGFHHGQNTVLTFADGHVESVSDANISGILLETAMSR